MIEADVKLGKDVRIFDERMVNIYGCEIGDRTFVGLFVEIQRGAKVGPDCKIESHALIADGVTVGRGVFVGHHVMFTNDLYPRYDRQVERHKTLVDDFASLGACSVIRGGITIGKHAIVGAGAVVTRSVPPLSIVAGNPARIIRSFESEADLLAFIEQRQATAGGTKQAT